MRDAAEQGEDGKPLGRRGGPVWHPPLARLFPVVHRRLARNVGALAEGIGGVLFVRGEPGMGTSWIANEAVALHAGPTRRGRASAATRPVPLWPFHEALASGSSPSPAPAESAPTGDHASFEEINAVTDALGSAEDDVPTLVVLEHLEHADRASLAAMERLAERCADRPVLCIATVRSTGLSPADEAMDAVLARDLAQRVEMEPVPPHLMAELVAGILERGEPPAELVQVVVDQSGGLPHLAERIVRSAIRRRLIAIEGDRWRVAGPLARARPDDVVWRTGRALMNASPIERDLVVAAAVLNGPVELSVLSEAAGCDLDVAVDHLQRCIDLDLLRRSPPSVAVRSGLIRDIVLESLTARTSPEVLGRLAAAASVDGELGPGFERAVAMLEQSGQPGAAVQLRLRVAARALAAGDLALAARQLAAARPDGEDTDARLQLATLSLAHLAIAGTTVATATAAADLLDGLAPQRAASTRIALARAIAACDIERAATIAAEAADIGRLDGDETAWAELLPVLAQPVPARRAALRARAAASDDGGVADCTALRHLAALELPMDWRAATVALNRARVLAADSQDAVEQRRVAAALAQLELLQSGTLGRFGDDAHALRVNGDTVGGAALTIEAALALLWAGHPRSATALLDDVHHRALDLATDVAYRALIARAGVAVARGDAVEVGRILVAAAPLGPPSAPAARLVDALAALVAGEPALPLIANLVLAEDPGPCGVAETQWSWVPHLAPLVGRLEGDRTIATPTPWSWTAHGRAIAGAVAAVDQAVAGDVDAAVAGVTTSDAALADAPFIQLLVRRLVGELAVRDGWASRPIELLLRAALARAVEDEHRGIARRLRAILRDGGFAVPRFGAGGGAEVPIDLRATGVTTREMEILWRLRAGASTAEVAEELFISAATVKSHVAHAMHKLGYCNRRDLLDAIGDAPEAG